MTKKLSKEDKQRLKELRYCKRLAESVLKDNPDDQLTIDIYQATLTEIKKLTK